MGLALQNAGAQDKMVHAAEASSISPDEALKSKIARMKKDRRM
jgi:hypothetical protein